MKEPRHIQSKGTSSSHVRTVLTCTLPLVLACMAGVHAHSFVCFCTVAIVSYILAFLCPRSPIQNIPMNNLGQVGRAVLTGFLVFECTASAALTQITLPAKDFEGTSDYLEGFIKDYNQYDQLADAFLHGSLSLDLNVPNWLAQMDNPYDAQTRLELGAQTGEKTYFDYAFYKGKYYCYFGPLPAVLLFIPYKIITGTDLRTDIAVAASGITLCLAIAFFLRTLVRKIYEEVPLGTFLLLDTALFFGCGTVTMLFLPWFYSLPPLMALVFLMMGLGFLLSAKLPDTLDKRRLCAGSLCIACTILCRPQLFLGILLTFVIFHNEIKNGLFFSKKGLANTLCIILPALAIGAIAMTYNFLRFESPFNFGASYNLTGFDMTAHKSFDITLAYKSIYAYLLLPIDFTRSFPFMRQLDLSPLVGNYPVEPYYGGFFWFAPFAFSIFMVVMPKMHHNLHRHGVWGLFLGCILLSLPLMVISSQVASISMRYMADFAWAILIAATCVWLVLIKDSSHPQRLNWILFVLVFFTAALPTLNLFSGGRYKELVQSNPRLYQMVASWF